MREHTLFKAVTRRTHNMIARAQSASLPDFLFLRLI